MIVHKSEPVTLIGGSGVSPRCLHRALAVAPHLVAADGGADNALDLGSIPIAVIGDFDSISDTARARLPKNVLHSIDEQDSTDFDKCLRNIAAPLVVGVGFTGKRLDHQLATYNTLVRYPERPCILFGADELVFLCPPALALDLEPGTGVSLFPMGAVEGVSDGLHWPIGGLNFAPDGRIGTSNKATGRVELSMTTPKMLMILPEQAFETVAAALLETPSSWSLE